MIFKYIAFFLAFFLVLAIIKIGCNRAEDDAYSEEIQRLINHNNDLADSIEVREKQIKAYRDSIDDISGKVVLLAGENVRLKNNISILKKDSSQLRLDAEKVSSDSSYAFLDKTAYPYSGEKKYPFNEHQVKEIHLNFIDNIACMGVLSESENLISNLEEQLILKDKQLEYLESSLYLSTENLKTSESIISNKDEEIGIKNEQIKKEKGKTLFWKIVTGVVVVIGTGLAL